MASLTLLKRLTPKVSKTRFCPETWVWHTLGDSNSSADCFEKFHPLQKRSPETSSWLCNNQIPKSVPDSLFAHITTSFTCLASRSSLPGLTAWFSPRRPRPHQAPDGERWAEY